MKIAESGIVLDASHQSVEFHHRSERLEITLGGPSRADAQAPPGLLVASERLSLSRQASSLQLLSGEIAAEQELPAQDPQSRFEVSLLKMLIERITGRRIKLFDPAELQAVENDGKAQQGEPPHPQTTRGGQEDGFGLRYEYHEIHHESEQMQFHAGGRAVTEDGREISFDVQLNLSREFTEQVHLEVTAGDALKDPLVINFDGNSAQLTQRDFRFDLDMDGTEDQIAFVKPGSGLLALDRNQDGVVNDGSELFGPSTGDGFDELAAYDSDGNQWIDENDPIYEQLRIWTRDPSGNQRLLGLGAANVGAIYLGNVSTPFALKDEQNEQLGQLRASGVYLKESGEAGVIQQLDLVV